MTVMQEEIFGPILPVVTAETLDEALAFIHERDRRARALLVGSDRAKQRKVLAQTISGGVCINDAMVHYLQENLPFGGVGASGWATITASTASRPSPRKSRSSCSRASRAPRWSNPPFTGFSRKFVNILRRMA